MCVYMSVIALYIFQTSATSVRWQNGSSKAVDQMITFTGQVRNNHTKWFLSHNTDWHHQEFTDKYNFQFQVFHAAVDWMVNVQFYMYWNWQNG